MCTIMFLCGYAVLDESLRMLIRGHLDVGYFLAALLGIFAGILSAALLAQHHRTNAIGDCSSY